MIEISPEDLRIETWPPRASVGGQQVGVVTGVKVTHLPSGIEAFVNTNRSQHRNKEIAIDMVLGGLTSPSFRA